MPKTDKYFLCQVQNCPNESNAPADDKLEYQNALERVFGDDLKVVNCEKIRNKDNKVLFCEMLIESDHADRSECPKGFKVILELQDD